MQSRDQHRDKIFQSSDLCSRSTDNRFKWSSAIIHLKYTASDVHAELGASDIIVLVFGPATCMSNENIMGTFRARNLGDVTGNTLPAPFCTAKVSIHVSYVNL
jgi:hypothetical protein